MLEWMIAITAVCGAISGLAILYFALRAALHMRSERGGTKAALGGVRCGNYSDDDAILPRATVHRVSPTLGLRSLRRFRIARHRAS
jgi:hypothetical protein